MSESKRNLNDLFFLKIRGVSDHFLKARNENDHFFLNKRFKRSFAPKEGVHIAFTINF